MGERSYHAPVLAEEAVSFLVTNPEGIYVDATVGGGGHAEKICSVLRGGGRLVGFDCDADALHASSDSLNEYKDRITFFHANFSAVHHELYRAGIHRIHGAMMDLGVSSFQLDEVDRGFSYRTDAPLDMRMDRRQSFTAADVVNGYEETELARVITRFGEERYAKAITRMILRRRPVESTYQLRDAVRSAVGQQFLTKSLARVFQAIRIEVNNELENLASALDQLTRLLLPKGRLVVISYHSLEDRIVKQFLRDHSRFGGRNAALEPAPILRILTKKPISPPYQEVQQNPRARSAKMRVAERYEER